MYELNKFENVDEYIESIRENSQGTPFEGLADVLEEHRRMISYYFEHSDEVTPDFIGSQEALFREGVEIDGEKLADILEEKDEFSAADSYKYAIDFNEFLLDVAKNKTASWDEFVSYFLEVRDILPDNRERAKEIFNEIQEDSRENLLEQIDYLVEFYGEIGGESAVIQFEHEKARINRMSKEEIYITSKEKELEQCREVLDMIEWREENKAEVGDYIVYEAHVENNRDFEELDVEVTPETVYNVILKVTDKVTESMSGEEVQYYEVQSIAFDNEMKEIWPEHFVMNEEALLSPQEQNDMTVYEENPLGSVEMKILNHSNPNHNYAFREGYGEDI